LATNVVMLGGWVGHFTPPYPLGGGASPRQTCAGLTRAVEASFWNVALVASAPCGDESAGMRVRESTPLAGRGCHAALGQRAGQLGFLLALCTMRGREGAVGAEAGQPELEPFKHGSESASHPRPPRSASESIAMVT